MTMTITIRIYMIGEGRTCGAQGRGRRARRPGRTRPRRPPRTRTQTAVSRGGGGGQLFLKRRPGHTRTSHTRTQTADAPHALLIDEVYSTRTQSGGGKRVTTIQFSVIQ